MLNTAHLLLHIGKHACGTAGCRERASRLIRCTTCKAVIARCGTHGANMARERERHCAR
jgi:hypothetical protein